MIRSARHTSLSIVRSLQSSLPSGFAPLSLPNLKGSTHTEFGLALAIVNPVEQRAQLNETPRGHQRVRAELSLDMEQCKR